MKTIRMMCMTVLLSACGASEPQPPMPGSIGRGSATIRVEVSGLRPAQGEVRAAVFNGEAGWPESPYEDARRIVPATSERMVIEFSAVPSGTYAASAIQDLNGNEVLDKNFVGLPTEPWAASNDVRPLTRGPTFDESRFSVEEGQSVTIQLSLR